MPLKFTCVEAKQGTHISFYIGALPFGQVWPLCTVSPREPRSDDPLFSDQPIPENQTPQRAAVPKRLEEIADFVAARLEASDPEKKEAVFPGTVILGLLADIEAEPTFPAHPDPTSAYLCPSPVGGMIEIWLPEKSGTLFIIDGQHRLKGLARLAERYQERASRLEDIIKSGPLNEANNEELKKTLGRIDVLRAFQVPISLLIDFDLAEQAMVFAQVNFNQKPVSRSFYYDIFGAFESDKVTTISFTHDLVLHLNNSELSPLKGMIKLLGRGPGLISQAFLAARLVLLVDPDHPKSVFRNFFLRRQGDDKTASRQVASLVRSFFAAVRSEFPYAWATRHDGKYSAYHYHYILNKSMVVSGLLAIMADIYRLTVLDFALGREAEVAETQSLDATLFALFLIKIDQPGRADPQKSNFARGSPWAIGGSATLEKRIYISLRAEVYSAYKDIATTPGGVYSKLIQKFGGAGMGVDLLKQDLSSDAFWTRTESIWLQSIKATSPVLAARP